MFYTSHQRVPHSSTAWRRTIFRFVWFGLGPRADPDLQPEDCESISNDKYFRVSCIGTLYILGIKLSICIISLTLNTFTSPFITFSTQWIRVRYTIRAHVRLYIYCEGANPHLDTSLKNLAMSTGLWMQWALNSLMETQASLTYVQ